MQSILSLGHVSVYLCEKKNKNYMAIRCYLPFYLLSILLVCFYARISRWNWFEIVPYTNNTGKSDRMANTEAL